MNSDYFEAETSQHDEAFKELKSLRSALLEQKHFNSTLKHQLRRATKIQFKLQMTLNIMEEQLQEKFDEVAAKRKKMDTTNVTATELVGHTRRQRQYDDRIIGEIQVISSDDEEPEPLQHVNPNQKRKGGASGSEAHAVEVEQGHQRNDSAEGALNVEQNHQLAHVEAQVLSHTRLTNQYTQSKDDLRRKNYQVRSKRIVRKNIYACEKCGRTFLFESLLTRHLRSHTGEKPFQCFVCGVAFSQAGNLTIHEMIHSDAKPFGCLVCNVFFNRKINLSRHLMVHVNEKPFQCDICKRSYRRKDRLVDHMDIHRGGKTSQMERVRKVVSQ